MDPITVVFVLALNLLASGGLFLLISRRMPPQSGLGTFAAGAMTFGLAYGARLATGIDTPAPMSALTDSAMVLGALLFIGGVRQFLGRRALRRGLVAGTVLVYGLLAVYVASRWGTQGRHVVLNMGLGLMYVMLAAVAVAGASREVPALRLPLRVLGVVMGLLGLFTMARSVHIGLHGTADLFHGLWAQLYYAYASLAAMLISPNLVWMVFVRLNGQLADLAARDALTRTLNRNGLDDALRHHFGQRPHQSVTWLQVDIDRFKQINDTHGHVAGDAVLKSVADLLMRTVRAGDFVARTGGEEFLIGCVGADAATAGQLGERLRSGVAALRTPVPGSDEMLSCTVSIGISHAFRELAAWEAAARVADLALYAAKVGGRNRVVLQD